METPLEQDGGISRAPAWFIWPLYNFKLSSPQVALFDGLQIWTYDKDTLHGALGKMASEHILDYFEKVGDPDALLFFLGEMELRPADAHGVAHIVCLVEPALLDEYPSAWKPVTVLRLFKQGVFRRGPLFIASGTGILAINLDPESGLAPFTETEHPFTLTASEAPCLLSFSGRILPILRSDILHPRLSLALSYFHQSYLHAKPEYQVVDLCIVLESLFLQEEMELGYKLSVRAALLLATEETELEHIATNVRRFYDVRSKVLHGAVLREKHKALLQEVETLRGYARRAIRAFLSLSRKYRLDSSFYEMLDKLPLNSSLRETVWGEARGLEPSAAQ